MYTPHRDGWIGASLLRKEDHRHLIGAACFVADIRLAGMQDVAFVRSDVAHGVLKRVGRPAGSAGRVFTLADLGAARMPEAGPELAAFRNGPCAPLADGKVRYAGQAIAACVGIARASAEDLADQV